MSNEIQKYEGNTPFTMDDNKDFVADLTNVSTMFSSLKAETKEEKATLFKAMNNPDKRLKDCINMTIHAKDLFCEVVQCTNQETGEVINCPRIVIVDKDGIGHQSVSLGIYNAVKKIIQVYGAPTWSPPIPITIKTITKGVNSILTFDIKA